MRPLFRSTVWITCAFLMAGSSCTDRLQSNVMTERDASVRRSQVALLDPSQWRTYPREEDPLASHQPGPIDCGPAGWYVEPAWDPPLLEIDTTFCNYVLLEQPAAAAVAEGDPIEFELRHYDLRAPEPAEAHIAWSFGGELEWETSIAIPSDAAVHVFEWRAKHGLAAGEAIRLHLHNHGQNTWLIAGLTGGAESECSARCD
jgi:hypothetical protein